MKRITFFLIISVMCWVPDSRAADEGFTLLFNGRNLDGWVNVNCAPETWTVRDGLIVCTGIPTGVLRTEKQYENYILELEWRHIHERGNAGLFIHSDPVTAVGQPFTRSVEITAIGDKVTITVNGKTVIREAWLPGLPARGPIGLQHHGDHVQFANIFIKELE